MYCGWAVFVRQVAGFVMTLQTLFSFLDSFLFLNFIWNLCDELETYLWDELETDYILDVFDFQSLLPNCLCADIPSSLVTLELFNFSSSFRVTQKMIVNYNPSCFCSCFSFIKNFMLNDIIIWHLKLSFQVTIINLVQLFKTTFLILMLLNFP